LESNVRPHHKYPFELLRTKTKESRINEYKKNFKNEQFTFST